MDDELATPRLRLRRARMDDLDAIHALLSDPRNMRYWSTPPHETLTQSEDWLRSMVEADPAVSDDFIIEHAGRVIGKMGCWRLPEIGYMVDADLAGQGLASEALAAYLDHRRCIGSPARITADVDPRNQASLALLIKHGFVETGRAQATWVIAGERCDSVYLALDL